MKFIDSLNKELEDLTNEYAHYNASGIPCTVNGQPMKFTNLKTLPTIALNEHTAHFLVELSKILEKYM